MGKKKILLHYHKRINGMVQYQGKDQWETSSARAGTRGRGKRPFFQRGRGSRQTANPPPKPFKDLAGRSFPKKRSGPQTAESHWRNTF